MRQICGYALVILSLLAVAADHAQAAPGVQIVPETAAARYGLTRPWFTQVQVDRTRGKIDHIVLHDGTLFVQTDRAVLQAVDAETGQTLWVTEVGRRDHPSMRPSVNRDMVATINGSHLYVLNRHTGRLLWQREIEGAPGAGPALSELRAFVPTTTGLVLAYALEAIPDPALELGLFDPNSEADVKALEERRREGLRLQQQLKPPLACQSFGRAFVQPLITRENAGEEYVAWPTDRGFLFVGRINRQTEDYFEMLYKLETSAEITARPTFLPAATNDPADSGVIFVASRDGFLHAIRERDGASMWRFSTGEPVIEPAAPIADRVYVATRLGGMYCLDVQTGQQLWWAPGIMRFVAAGQGRVYVEDHLGNLVVLHAASGGRLDTIPAAGLPIKLMNLQTDRIYLATQSGLVQCLREIELVQPILHRAKPAPEKVEPKPKETAPEAPPQPKAPIGPSPFEAGGAAADPFGGGAPGGTNPFGGGADPFGGGAAPGGADPFGGGAAPSGADPFGAGAAPGGADPFGAGAAPGGADPFGGGAAPGGADPFGAGAAPGGADPFGAGATPAEDPFG